MYVSSRTSTNFLFVNKHSLAGSKLKVHLKNTPQLEFHQNLHRLSLSGALRVSGTLHNSIFVLFHKLKIEFLPQIRFSIFIFHFEKRKSKTMFVFRFSFSILKNENRRRCSFFDFRFALSKRKSKTMFVFRFSFSTFKTKIEDDVRFSIFLCSFEKRKSSLKSCTTS